MIVRKATLSDLDTLVHFTAQEAIEAESLQKIPETLEIGIKTALLDSSIAMYWVLQDSSNNVIGSVSSLKEWSDWNAGYYWWIQSMYIVPEQRGKGLMHLLLNAVKKQMVNDGGLELRLYVHKDNTAAQKAYQKFGFNQSDYLIMRDNS